MKLCYRGVPYQLQPVYFPVTESKIEGTYRSQSWNKKEFPVALKPLSAIPTLLKFKGQIYEKTRFELINQQLATSAGEVETTALA